MTKTKTKTKTKTGKISYKISPLGYCRSVSMLSVISMTQLSSHTFAHLTGSSFRLKAKLLPIKNILGVQYNEVWLIWLGGGKGYFRHSSKLFYIKGIAVGQPPISYHFWVCWWTSFFRKCYFLYLFHITEKTFFWKSTLRLSCRYATFSRLRSPKGEARLKFWCQFDVSAISLATCR